MHLYIYIMLKKSFFTDFCYVTGLDSGLVIICVFKNSPLSFHQWYQLQFISIKLHSRPLKYMSILRSVWACWWSYLLATFLYQLVTL